MDSEAGVQGHMDHRWGLSLPEEVLVHIFQMVVIQDGAVPFLCRMARVCHLWNAAASAPSLWRRVSVGYCWIEPGKTQFPKTEMKIKDTLHWLAENRFSHLRDFSLCHWEKNVDYAVEVVSQSCPHLRSLTLSYCYGVTEKTFQSLGANSRSLEGINVQYSETFRIRNGTPMPTVMRNGPDSTTGFPLLEELLIGGTYGAFLTNEKLSDILFGSTKLRVLNLSGCAGITSFGLAALPCVELECLFWGQDFLLPKQGLHMLTEKWSGTLRELDITNHLFSEEDLQMAMSYLAQATPADSLCSLHLSGTKITPPALRLVIGQSTALSYLNLSSCCHLPRELQRVHRGQEDIRQLLDHLD
ncbi:F-box/LRR-repeat protein 6-like [Diretmus argenteus]